MIRNALLGILFSLVSTAAFAACPTGWTGLGSCENAGTAALQNTGTSGANLGLLNANKTDSGTNLYSGTDNFTGTFEIAGVTVSFPTSGLLVGTTDAATLTNKTITSPVINGATLNGSILGTPTYTGIPIFSGLASGTQTKCLGLDSGNNLVYSSGACGSGSGSGVTFTDGTHTITGATQLTFSGATVGGTSPNATVTISGSSGLAVGSTTISGGTNGDFEVNNAGVLGEVAATGTGNVVRATSPTLVTPALGTPSALTLTNATGLPQAGIAGIAANSLVGNPTGSSGTGQSVGLGTGLAVCSTNICPVAPNRSSGSAITFTSADFAGQVNSTGTTNTATVPATGTFGANQTILLTNQGSGNITITDSQTVNGLANALVLHSHGFYAYTGNGASADAFGFPGYDTITASSVPIFSDASGALTASEISDAAAGGVTIGSPTGGQKGAGTLNATNLYVNGTAVAAGGSGTVGSGTTGQIATYASSGTAVGGASAIPSGITATTQSVNDNSTKLATTAYVDRPIPTTTGTTHTFAGKADIFLCTTTCTMTMPVPSAGVEYCAQNDVGVSTVITFSAIGSSAAYGKTDQSAYGTSGTGTAISGGAVGDRICFIGKDSTHYNTASSGGTWTMS